MCILPIILGTREGVYAVSLSSWNLIDDVNSPMTSKGLALAVLDSTSLYVVFSPTFPYFNDATKGILLLAISESVRAWLRRTGASELHSEFHALTALQWRYDRIL